MRPSRVSHSAQSRAWILACRTRTSTSRSGQPFERAYIRSVIEVHAPSAAQSRPYGVGPRPVPPSSTGSSERSRKAPISISCNSPSPLLTTVSMPLT